MDILLLTREQCDFCAQAKGVLERLQAEYGFVLSLLDLQAPEGEALAMRHGIIFPPGVFLDGEPFSYGRLSERKLRRELDQYMRASKQPLIVRCFTVFVNVPLFAMGKDVHRFFSEL